MQSFDNTWEEIHSTQEWGQYPSEVVVRFVARNYYKNEERMNTRILDFGCRGGNHTWYLAREGFDVYAFDGSKSAIEKTRKKLRGEQLDADLRVLDATEINYDKDFFDAVIDNVSIYANTIENIKLMYGAVYNSLKNGGKFLSVVFSTDTYGFGTGKEIEYHTYKDIEVGNLTGRGIAHFFDKEELISLIQSVGFRDVSIDELIYTDNGWKVAQLIVCALK